jgi:putative membrane protein
MSAFLFVPVWGFVAPGFWVLVIGLIVLGTRGARATARDGGGPAVRLLEERYARGEISREEFLERRAVLEGSSPDAPQ